MLRQAVEASDVLTPWTEIASAVSAELGTSLTEDQVRNRARRIGVSRKAPTQSADPAQIFEFSKAFSGRASWGDLLAIVQNEALLVPEPTVPRIIPAAGKGRPETMNVMISDPHIGKLVDLSVVGNAFTGYGAGTFWERLKVLHGRIVRIAELQSNNAPIETLVLWFLGDLIDGTDMRRGHPHRVDVQSAARQVMIGRSAFSQLIVDLAPLFKKVVVNFQYGNHGRIGEFGVNLPADNWDYMMSLFIEADVTSLSGVTVNVPTTKYGIYDVAGQRIYAAHGDQMRGGGGPRTAKAYVENLKALHRQVFDLALIGHFHTSEFYTAGGTKAFSNGAWDGGDDFEVNQLVKANDPAQWAFGLSPTRGLTWQYEISLGPKRKSTPAIEVM